PGTRLQLGGVLARIRLVGAELVEVVVGGNVLEGVLLLLGERVLRIGGHPRELWTVLDFRAREGRQREEESAAGAQAQEFTPAQVPRLRSHQRRPHPRPPHPSTRSRCQRLRYASADSALRTIGGTGAGSALVCSATGVDPPPFCRAFHRWRAARCSSALSSARC